MASEEPIRIDASTVHRATQQGNESDAETGSVRESGAGSSLTEGASEGVEQITEANTVIRGSSRVEKSRSAASIIDRTPAAVTKGLLGTKLNHFHLEAFIGGGGMGAVFRGHDEQLDRTVAIKVIPFVGDDADLQRRFRNEAQSAAKLDHPRIARVFDVGSQGDWHYIVFEYIEGTNIRDLVTRNTVLPIDDAVFYTCELADALQHAADRGIVHRDIKPSNILIGGDSKLKLVDMGLARSESLDLSEDMTASGVTLGTFDYISPEQAKDPRDADLRSDIYSLGCTLYFMLTGSPPYPGGTMLQKLLSHGNAPTPDARALRPEVSDHLVAVIQKMLAKDPGDRYQTGFDLIADLREVAFRDGLSRSQSLGPVSLPQPNLLNVWLEKHASWIAASLVLVAIAVWFQLQSATSRSTLVIPVTAGSPEVGDSGQAAVEEFPVSRKSLDPQLRGTAGWDLDPGDERENRTAPPLSPNRDNNTSQDEEEAPSFKPLPITSGSDMENLRSDPGNADARAFEAAEKKTPRTIRIVDAPNVGVSADDVLNATTLREALLMASENKVNAIEITVPEILSEPVEFQIEDLWIRSTVSGGTIIRFIDERGVAGVQQSMLNLGSSDIVIEDISFVWDVPSGNVSSATLFEIKENTLLRLTDCSITVSNSNPSSNDRIYAFDVVTTPNRSGDLSTGDPEVQIELNNVIVRGEITMLHMNEAATLDLDWDNGLLAVSGSMIETGGKLSGDADIEGRIGLEFWRVTVHAEGGICRMQSTADTTLPAIVDRQARQSVFYVNEDNPHFEFSGFPERYQGGEVLLLRGSSNLYQVGPEFRDVMLRVAPESGIATVTQMMDLEESPPEWVVEKSPRRSSSILQKPENWPPASKRIPADYRQTDASSQGFTPDSLPTLPRMENSEKGELSAQGTL